MHETQKISKDLSSICPNFPGDRIAPVYPIIWGETRAPGGPVSKKIGIFGGIKLQIFGAENFEKLRFLMENWLFFGVLSENLAKF